MITENYIKELKPYNEFKYWFNRISEHMFQVINRETGEIMYPDTDENISGKHDDVSADFHAFIKRPEWRVGVKSDVNHNDISQMSQDEMINRYEVLMVGIVFIKARAAGLNPDDHFDRAYKIIEWLRSTDFYRAPASSRYHDCYPSGLLYHTLKVYDNMLELRKASMFVPTSYDSISLVSLCHDWCKIGLYEVYLKNVKDEKTGQWNQVEAYKRNVEGIILPLGHGVTSMFLAEKFFRLTPQEALAIRWHMSNYNVAESESFELEEAAEKINLVHMVQFADQLACTKYCI